MFAEKAKAPKLHEGVYLPGPDILKNSIIATPYQESAVGYGGLMKIIFRAYNDGVAFCYEFETKQDESIKIKQELTTFQFDNLHPFRTDRDAPEVLETFQVSKISDRYASVRIEKIPDCPTLIAGEVSYSGFVPIKLPIKFQQDILKPTTVNMKMDGDASIEGIGRPVRTPWRFVKIEQEDEMLEHLDITRNRL